MVVPIAAGGRVWQIGRMPVSDVVLLPLCLGLALIGVIVAGVAWRRGSRGRVLQGVGLALAPIALYFTGLLRLVWDAVVALVGGVLRFRGDEAFTGVQKIIKTGMGQPVQGCPPLRSRCDQPRVLE